MSGKIYNKNLTFLRDQPFAENLLTGFSYKKRANLSSTRASSFPTQFSKNDMQSTVGTHSSPLVRFSFGSTRVRNKSEKMRKAEISLVRHFCLILERTESLYTRESAQVLECSNVFKISNVIPHLLVSVDSMQNTLLATRGSRPSDRVKPPSHFKKVLQECRKIRLLYGNLSKRHLSRVTSKTRLPGENLLIWLESRLDVVLERCGFFGSVKAARQSVLNGKILVNSKKVRSPGFLLEGGDLIKVVQERLLFDPLNKQFSRGVILSKGVSSHLVRNKSLASAVSNTLPNSNTITELKASLSSSAGYEKTADTNFDSYRSLVWGFSPYKSFLSWLLKRTENNSQPSDLLRRQSKALLSTGLQSNNLSTQNTVFLDKKVSSSNNWRFKGSPHLLFSLFFLHAHLQEIMSSIVQTYNKSVIVDKKFGIQEFYKTQNWNKTSTRKYKAPWCSSYSCSCESRVDIYRGYLNLPAISSVSKYCVANTFAINTGLCTSKVNKKVGSLIDTFKIELFLNLIRQSFQINKNNRVLVDQKVSRYFASQSSTIAPFHNSLEEGLLPLLTEVYNIFFISPWFIYLNKNKCFSRDQDLSQLLSSLVKKDEKSLLYVLLSNLLLYSLLIKKEVVRAQLKKEQVNANNQVVSRVLPVSVTRSKKQKTFDSRVSTNLGFPAGPSRVVIGNSRLSKVGSKKSNCSTGFDYTQARRIKPLHLEVSYQSLSAVYLFPPQRICLPVMIDLDCLAKAF